MGTVYRIRLGNAVREFTINCLSDNKDNQRKFWQELKKVLPSKNKVIIDSIIGSDGEMLYDKNALDYVNNFFSTVGDRIETKIRAQPTPYPPPVV